MSEATGDTTSEVGESASVPWALLTLPAITSLGFGGIFALVAELRSGLDIAESTVGLVVAVGFLAGLLTQITLAPLADRGHTRALVLGGLLVAAAGVATMAAANEAVLLGCGRFAFGLGAGATGPAVRRLVVVRAPEDVGKNLGLMSGADIGGFILGPALAGAISSLTNYRVALGVIAAVIALWALRAATIDLSSEPGVQQPRQMRILLRRRPFQAVLAASAAFALTIGAFEGVWALLLTDRGAEEWFIGLTLSLFTIPMVILAPMNGKLAQRRGPFLATAVGIPIAIVCMAAYGVVGGLLPLVAVSLVHAIGDSFTLPALSVGTSAASPLEQYGAAQGIASAVTQTTAGLTAAAAAAAYGSFGVRPVFLGGAAVMAVLFAVSQVLGPDLRKPIETAADQL